MLQLLALLLILWVVLIIVGAVIKALFWLIIIGAVLFLLTAAFGWSRRDSARR